jgi:putative secretion ATPase (PEP-CTERM system associated)
MYTDFYKLNGRPFQLSPDPRFFFGSRGHKKAMAYLTYGLTEREGFIVITGEVGAGKTTLVGHLLSRIDRTKIVHGHVVTTQLEADDALRMVASAFGIAYRDVDKASLLRAIESFLVDARHLGKHVLLVVDEVQNMPTSALEELRMLSNFQLDGKPLFQCFLLGQPQFRRIIASEDMEQMRQRVIASCHLGPLDDDEVREYVEHRLALTGWHGDPLFTDDSFKVISMHTGGMPRRINNLCARILLYGSLEELHRIDGDVVEQVARELATEGTQHSSYRSASEVQGSTPLEIEPMPKPAPSPAPQPEPKLQDAQPDRTPPAAPPSAPVTHLNAPVAAAGAPAALPVAPQQPEQTILDLQERVRILRGGR